MQQQLINITGPLRRQAGQNVLQVNIRIMPVELGRLDQLISAAARLPLRNDPAKSQFFLPRAQGRICCSIWLLSMGNVPSFR